MDTSLPPTKTACFSLLLAIGSLGILSPGAEAGSLKRTAANTPLILMYHDIIPDSDPSPTTGSIRVSKFAAQMDLLRRNGFQSLSMEEYQALVAAKKPIPPKAVILSFDDGYLGNLERAAPILERAPAMKAGFYVNPAHVGESEHMNWDQLRKLEANPRFKIYSHTLTHPFLTHFTEEGRPALLARIQRLRSRLEQLHQDYLTDQARPPANRQGIQDCAAGIPIVPPGNPECIERKGQLKELGALRDGSRQYRHQELMKEIVESCRQIEVKLHNRPLSSLHAPFCAGSYFAIPFGDQNAEVRAALAEAGYRMALAIDLRNKNDPSMRALPRMMVRRRGADEPASAVASENLEDFADAINRFRADYQHRGVLSFEALTEIEQRFPLGGLDASANGVPSPPIPSTLPAGDAQ